MANLVKADYRRIRYLGATLCWLAVAFIYVSIWQTSWKWIATGILTFVLGAIIDAGLKARIASCKED